MKDPLPYVYNFLEIVFSNTEARRYIKNAILFGSVATGEYDKESDIDVFIDVSSEEVITKAESIIKDAEKRFYAIVEKKWSLMGMEMPIKCIVGSLGTYRWQAIRNEIISTGISLYGKYSGIKEGLRHFSLFSYDMSELSGRDKSLFVRRLFGYSQKRKGKEYRTAGYLQEAGGLKIGKNAILCPIEKSRELQKLFVSFRLTPEIREIWVKEYGQQKR
ncbi:MAG: nucleotidyltransferase domain-containing protein [Candidatus Aenigmarchaeota archaeon]|nr:nucleotidyltransferase domain-containing protein [Candidatus Aenigmarchaeota archaeon]